LAEHSPFALRGAAQAELLRRDREYAEQREQSRREFETAQFNAEGDRDAKRKEFEKALAERQMDHATTLAKDQIGAAQSAARAARWAAWATAAAALGAVAQAIIAALK
jgi:hypothetical protein